MTKRRQRRAAARRRRRDRSSTTSAATATAAGRTRDHGLTSATPYTPGRHEGPHPRRRRRHAAAADHPHQRQAAGAGGQQADPVLRDRGMVAAGITEIGMIVGDTRDEVMAGARRRLAVRCSDHLHPAGRAARAGPLRAHRPRLPRRRRLRDVPRRQPARAGPRGVRATRSRPSPHERAIRRRRRSCSSEVPDPHRFGIAELDAAGNVVHLVEKPADPPSTSRSSASTCSIATIHDAVRAIEPSPRGELEITDAIQWLIDHGQRVRHGVLTGWWIDTGKLTPLLEANRLLLENDRDRASTARSTSRSSSTVASWSRPAPDRQLDASAARWSSAPAR